MNFLFELIGEFFVGVILRFILLCVKIVVEVVFIDFLGEVVRFIGVCFLCTVGRIARIFNPHKMTYSFNAMWTMEYDKRDSYMMMIEAIGQRIAGFMVIGVVIFICLAI